MSAFAYMKNDRRNLLDVVLEVHMTTTGAMERYDSDQIRDIRMLQEILLNWEPSHPQSVYFDDAVKQLVERAIEEWNRHGR